MQPLRLNYSIASIVLLVVSSCFAQHQPAPPGHDPGQVKRTRFIKAFVVDDRLSSLRREPSSQSQIIQRLRLGRPVFITRVSTAGPNQPRYCRVAVTRRTRGWILQSALAIPGRIAEDQRVMKLIDGATDGLDRITLSRLLIERFSHSKLVPRAMLLIGEEADRAAKELTRRAKRRLSAVNVENSSASVRDYYLNDAGLDRYSKLRVAFDFNESKGEYVYNGQAYRDVVRRFPNTEEAELARRRLEASGNRLTRRL